MGAEPEVSMRLDLAILDVPEVDEIGRENARSQVMAHARDDLERAELLEMLGLS